MLYKNIGSTIKDLISSHDLTLFKRSLTTLLPPLSTPLNENLRRLNGAQINALKNNNVVIKVKVNHPQVKDIKFLTMQRVRFLTLNKLFSINKEVLSVEDKKFLRENKEVIINELLDKVLLPDSLKGFIENNVYSTMRLNDTCELSNSFFYSDSLKNLLFNTSTRNFRWIEDKLDPIYSFSQSFLFHNVLFKAGSYDVIGLLTFLNEEEFITSLDINTKLTAVVLVPISSLNDPYVIKILIDVFKAFTHVANITYKAISDEEFSSYINVKKTCLKVPENIISDIFDEARKKVTLSQKKSEIIKALMSALPLSSEPCKLTINYIEPETELNESIETIDTKEEEEINTLLSELRGEQINEIISEAENITEAEETSELEPDYEEGGDFEEEEEEEEE